MIEHDTTKCEECKASDEIKSYIGREEAYEILLEHFPATFERLPRVGREYVAAFAIASGKRDFALGKDESGYYVKTV